MIPTHIYTYLKPSGASGHAAATLVRPMVWGLTCGGLQVQVLLKHVQVLLDHVLTKTSIVYVPSLLALLHVSTF